MSKTRVIKQVSPTVANRSTFHVEVKRNWSDYRWTRVPWLDVVQWVDCVAPQIPSAYLTWNAGKILWGSENMPPTDHEFLPSGFENNALRVDALDGLFVRIIETRPPIMSDGKVIENGATNQVWVGVIQADAISLYGLEDDAPDPSLRSGQQTITCVGLEHLLNIQTIHRAVTLVESTGIDPDIVSFIDWAPDFNKTFGIGDVVQNMTGSNLYSGAGYTYYEDENGWDTRCFIDENNKSDSGGIQYWSDAWIAQYLLRYFNVTSSDEDPREWCHYGIANADRALHFGCDDYSLLASQTRTISQEGRTIYEVLNELASPDLGLTWRVVCDDLDSPSVMPKVCFYSRVSSDNPIDISLHAKNTVKNIISQRAFSERYSKIRVVGERAVMAMTASEFNGVLKRAWTDEEEQQYKDGVKDTLYNYDYISIDDAATVNDAFRRTPEMRRVYNSFTVGPVAGTHKGFCVGPSSIDYCICPEILNGGVIRYIRRGSVASERLRWWNKQLRILPWLPFKSGEITRDLDNTGVSGVGEPFVLIPHPDTSDPVYGESPDDPILLRRHDSSVFDTPTGGLTVSKNGEEVRSTWHPPHRAAGLDLFADSEPTKVDPDVEYGCYSYKLQFVTLAFELDQRLYYEIDLPSSREIRNELVVSVPNANLWLVAPGTFISDISSGYTKGIIHPDTGVPVYFRVPEVLGENFETTTTEMDHIDTDAHRIGPDVLRNDWERLKDIADWLEGVYGVDRKSVTWSENDLTYRTPIVAGDYVGNIDPDLPAPIVTESLVVRIVYNNGSNNGDVTYQTGETDVKPVIIAQSRKKK